MSWASNFDETEHRDAIDEACVDCYGPSEQFLGLFNMAEQEMTFPFSATVMGESVEIISAVPSQLDSLGIDLVVQRNGNEYPIAATSIELADPLPDGHIYLAAYLRWKAKQ